MRQRVLLLFVCAGLCFTSALQAESALPGPPPDWPGEVVDLFATLPVLDGGRVKPLDTVARFTLLRLNGRRSLRVEYDGGTARLTPIEWYLDCLFFPETAMHYRHFSVETSDVIVALGLQPHGRKRDRYSYSHIAPGRERLMELANEASRLPDERRDFMDRQLIALANNVLAFEGLAAFMEIARERFVVADNLLLAGAFPDREEVRISDIAAETPDFLTRLTASAHQLDDSEREALARDMQRFFGQLDRVAHDGNLLALIPPADHDDPQWMTPASVLEAAFEPEKVATAPIHMLELLEAMVTPLPDKNAFAVKAAAFHEAVTGLAEARGEYARIPLEVTYYRGRFFFLSQWLFLFAFIMTAFSWALPQSRRLAALLNLSLAPPLVLLAIGITLRCIIRGRPPVTNVYETILFTTLVAAALGFSVEFINRRRIAMSMGALLGMLGMFFASRYEARGGMDTMPAVIAVLDTNFWLATHVTTIIAGYGAGLFGAALAHVYIFGRLLGINNVPRRFYAELGRVIYGVTCFCLVFTLIGTVLGGVWAAQSWGRFWGWDPKENGALLIVLWALAMMHAKRGGYLRHGGIAVSAVVLGMIIVFAWWGVNALGVGLHSYGFVSGAWRGLIIFWLLQSIVTLAGLAALTRPVKT